MRPLTDLQEFQRFLASFTNYERLPTFRYGPQTLGLERMRELARALGDPQDAYPSVHIGGTKGKGSTTLMLEALLSAEGLRVGSYTSPHVEHLSDRIRVGGRRISEPSLVEAANLVLPALSPRLGTPDPPTFFELMTAIAMLRFRKDEVDFGLFEVGLGGRLDATNILSAQLTAITSIGLEHTHLLGNSLEAIAGEKAGIIKPGVPLVIGELAPEARRVIEATARERGAPLAVACAGDVRLVSRGILELAGVESPLRAPAVRGPGLRADLSIALWLFRKLLERLGRSFDPARARRALAELELPARVEIFAGEPAVCLDGAHTTESIEVLAVALEEERFPRPRTLVFSLAADKRRDDILALLPAIAEDVVFARADPVRSLAPQALRDAFGAGTVVEDPHQALRAALERGRAVVVTGSIYLAGALRAALKERAALEAPRAP
jgi:dihydrofolate synthase/folylpolyglutamate synthase